VSDQEEQWLKEIVEEVLCYVISDSEKYGTFNTTHEAYGILLEEVDELWDEIKKKRRKRDMSKMREETIQVAGIAIRFALDMKKKDYTKEPE
jgi:hypothetical protein